MMASIYDHIWFLHRSGLIFLGSSTYFIHFDFSPSKCIGLSELNAMDIYARMCMLDVYAKVNPG